MNEVDPKIIIETHEIPVVNINTEIEKIIVNTKQMIVTTYNFVCAGLFDANSFDFQFILIMYINNNT